MAKSILFLLTIFLAPAAFALAHENPNQHHFPFQTRQPDGRVITLTYQGDDEFHWYEDENGFTVVDARGEFRYATLGADGLLAATNHLVGDVDPTAAGLRPHTLPHPKTLARLRNRVRARQASQAVPVNDRIPPDSRLIDGCIMVRTTAQFNDQSGGDAQDGVSETNNFWTGGLVYYAFDPAVTADQRAAMLDAMDSWEAVADVRFIERSSQANYIYIFSGSGNWSYVGMIGGRQDLSIYNWDYKYIMMHEVAHALGVWHEQSRPDRDDFVQINYGNVQAGRESNFDIQADAQMNGDYDFDSIMHYGQCAFANCTCSSACRTIICPAPYVAWQSQIGQKTHLSVGDAENMAFLYGDPSSTSGLAQMTTPAENEALITGGSQTFTWSTGLLVQEYRLTVGSGPGLGDYHDAVTNATSVTVNGLPVEGGDLHVRLYSKIGGVWDSRSYLYITDLCTGSPDNVDADGDGVPDGCDACPGSNDASDADNDGVPDGCDACAGSDDTADLDGDGLADGCDSCPSGDNDEDADGDGAPDACDACPDVSDAGDSDQDGVADCTDACPDDAAKTAAGICGCGESDVDSDEDGTPDCNDGCPTDASKLSPGVDGCNAEPLTGGGVAGGGPTGGGGGSGGGVDPGSTLTGGGMCGGGAAASTALLMFTLLGWPRQSRKANRQIMCRTGGAQN
ncbi:MAG TPA: M12 family metallopeptidase [Phycisphaerae bacterium]|nr:M12 family metallopeptidase [Phycisphaerae bacterium]